MALNDDATTTTTIDWLWARLRALEAELAAARAELALYEPVTVSTATTPHTLNVWRPRDNTHDWVENGVTLYAKADHP